MASYLANDQGCPSLTSQERLRIRSWVVTFMHRQATVVQDPHSRLHPNLRLASSFDRVHVEVLLVLFTSEQGVCRVVLVMDGPVVCPVFQ